MMGRLSPCVAMCAMFGLSLQARTKLTVQLPSKLLFDLAQPVNVGSMGGRGAGAGALVGAGGAGGAGLADDDDAFGCSLDVQQLNLVIRL